MNPQVSSVRQNLEFPLQPFAGNPKPRLLRVAASVSEICPLDFKPGMAKLPSGEYTIKPLSQSALLVQNDTSRARAIVLTTQVQAKKSLRAGKLVFNRYGDQYFLSEVWTPANKMGHELFRSQLERELAKSKSEHEVVYITALSEIVDVKLHFH